MTNSANPKGPQRDLGAIAEWGASNRERPKRARNNSEGISALRSRRAFGAKAWRVLERDSGTASNAQ